MNPRTPADRVIGLRAYQIAGFAIPATAMELVNFPVGSIIPVFYAQHTKVTLAQIGTIFLVMRLLDAFSDPLIGILSDRTPGRLGARKPWMLCGSLVVAVALFILFLPSRDATIVYFATGTILFYFGWSMIDIPYRAWSSEITRDYNERARVGFVTSIAGLLGILILAGTPFLPIFSTQAYDAHSLAVIGVAAALALPLAVALASASAPQGRRVWSAPPKLSQLFNAIRANKPMQFFFLIEVIWAASIGPGGLAEAMIYLYVSDYLAIADKFPYLLLAYTVGALLAAPIWLKIAYWLGKPLTWGTSTLLAAGTLVAFALLQPGSSLWLVLAVVFLRGATIAGGNPMPNIIFADTIDYDILRTSANRAGNYFAIFVLLRKAGAALGAGLGFYALAFLGYHVGHAATASPLAAIGVTNLLPALIAALAGTLMFFFPIDARRHGIIRRRIERRAQSQPVEALRDDHA